MVDIEPQLHSRRDLIDVLATGPGSANEIQLDIIRIDDNIRCDRNHPKILAKQKENIVSNPSGQFGRVSTPIHIPHIIDTIPPF